MKININDYSYDPETGKFKNVEHLNNREITTYLTVQKRVKAYRTQYYEDPELHEGPAPIRKRVTELQGRQVSLKGHAVPYWTCRLCERPYEPYKDAYAKVEYLVGSSGWAVYNGEMYTAESGYCEKCAALMSEEQKSYENYPEIFIDYCKRENIPRSCWKKLYERGADFDDWDYFFTSWEYRKWI